MLLVFLLAPGHLGNSEQLAKMRAQGLYAYLGQELVELLVPVRGVTGAGIPCELQDLAVAASKRMIDMVNSQRLELPRQTG
jgi:hypothetical protein